MSLDNLGNLAQIVSAVAVLATLIYRSVQIRQNRQILSSQTLLIAMQNFNDINRGIVDDADVARIWDSGSSDPDSLSPSDTTRFFMLARQVLNAYRSSNTRKAGKKMQILYQTGPATTPAPAMATVPSFRPQAPRNTRQMFSR